MVSSQTARLDPSPTLIAITVVLATLIHFPAIQGQETSPYNICGQPVQCGTIELEYPFSGHGRPDYCGHPGFQLTCRSNVPVLVLESVDYRVLDTDTSTHTIIIARNDLWTNICPQDLQNTTYDTALFNDNNFAQENVALYYGCEDNASVPLPANYRFPCVVNGIETDNYFYRTSIIAPNVADALVQCNSRITVPVERSSASIASESDLRSALRDGFKLEWMAKNNDCDRCVQSGGRCGSNATSLDSFVCYCARGNFSLTCNNSDEVSGGGSNGTIRKLIIGISCSITGIIFLLLVILCRNKRLCVTPKGPKATIDQVEIFIMNYENLAPKRYQYSEIKKMTNSFQEKLGQGGYGSVYKGQLPDGHLVAVKLLSEATGNGEDFINEVASISRTSHVNIVTLSGFCFEGKKRALLYEFMPNGSLDRFLRGDGFQLDWNTLFQIAKGIARGLEYLHRGCNTRIVHFDIKPHNILLDEEFVPKVSDFGLAKLCKKKESIVSVKGARGTVGYMAPEVYFRSLGDPSHKSDVYSYGMMVLEMTGARENNNSNKISTGEAYFPDWIYKQVEVEGNLGDYGVTTKEEEKLARKMMIVSLWCIQSNPSDRPAISKVVEMLEGSFESLQVPPRCFESSPARSFQGIPPTSTQGSSGDRLTLRGEDINLPSSHEASE